MCDQGDMSSGGTATRSSARLNAPKAWLHVHGVWMAEATDHSRWLHAFVRANRDCGNGWLAVLPDDRAGVAGQRW